MVASISASHSICFQSILDLFSRYQVFHLKTLQFSVRILAIHYVIFLSDVDIEFSINLIKYECSYLEYNIAHNRLVGLRMCSDS